MKKTAIEMIAEERIRQIEQLGYTPDSDIRQNSSGELARAAAYYAMPSELRLPKFWPWVGSPSSPAEIASARVRELVKAGALIVAEIERYQRLQNTSKPIQVGTVIEFDAPTSGEDEAFPVERLDENTGSYVVAGGMTKREYLAGMILAGLVSATELEFTDKAAAADCAIDFADNLLKKL